MNLVFNPSEVIVDGTPAVEFFLRNTDKCVSTILQCGVRANLAFTPEGAAVTFEPYESDVVLDCDVYDEDSGEYMMIRQLLYCTKETSKDKVVQALLDAYIKVLHNNPVTINLPLTN